MKLNMFQVKGGGRFGLRYKNCVLQVCSLGNYDMYSAFILNTRIRGRATLRSLISEKSNPTVLVPGGGIATIRRYLFTQFDIYSRLVTKLAHIQ